MSQEEIAPPEVGDALVVVDVQNDFLPGGSLAVPDGDAVVPVVNALAAAFEARRLPVYATRDWHPASHVSFVDNGGEWPTHCVQLTPGAEFAPGLELPEGTTVISKATAVNREAYSGFQGTDLHERMRELGVRRVWLVGLATDYCVLATARDALGNGYSVVIPTDGVRAVDVDPGDGERALAALAAEGVALWTGEVPA